MSKPKAAVAAKAATKEPPASVQTKATPPSDIFSQNKKKHLKDIESQALQKENENNKPKAGALASLTGAPSFKTGS